MSTPEIVGHRHGSAVITYPSDSSYLITRRFDAPVDLVFRALNTPELVQRWWGGCGTTEWKVCEIDFRVGGRWRYVIHEGGQEIGFHGEFREIDAPGRVVFTEMFEGVVPLPPPEDYPTNTVTLVEADGVTTMTILVQHKTREERDIVIATGMEQGMQASYDRLEDLVKGGV